MLKPSSVMIRRAARAGSSVGATGAGCACCFHSRCSGRNVTHGLRTSTNEKPGWRIACAMISAVPLGSPANARATKLAPGRERDHQRMERAHAGAAGRELGVPVGLGRRRRLALGHSVDVVVHHDVGQVDVAPARVQEVIAADRVAVAVAAGDEHRQFGARDLEAGCRGERAAVHAVEAVAGRVRGNARRAADAGDDDDLVRAAPHLRQRLGHASSAPNSRRSPDTRSACRPTCSSRGQRRGGSDVVHAGSISRTLAPIQSTIAVASSPGRSGSGPGRWKLAGLPGRS